MASNQALQKFNPQAAMAVNQRSLHELVQIYESQACNLIVPKTLISDVPPGFRFVATAVEVNPDPKLGDVYPIPGGDKLGIGKSKLNQISSSLGVTWVKSHRVDDRRHPHYVEWEVVGRMTLPDGTAKEQAANKTIDMRDDIGDGTPGADLKEIRDNAARKQRDPDREITQVRREIQSLAETKAQNRAIRAMAGLQTSYTAEQLRGRPFVAVKLALDPADPRASNMIMGNLAGGVNALYGPPKGEVIDAKLSGTAGDPPPPAAGKDAGAAETTPAPAAPASNPPDIDDQVDEKTGECDPPTDDEIKRRTGAAYAKIMGASKDFTVAGWKALLKSSTGKVGYKGLSWDELGKIDAAAEAFCANKQGG
jgi:hypothetical protein